ncbi:MAG TPA: hypothetical protein VH143_16460 [Kofleriaceae bacterium]|nr:hypothetical protein [Kofleriaceae bacterium]
MKTICVMVASAALAACMFPMAPASSGPTGPASTGGGGTSSGPTTGDNTPPPGAPAGTGAGTNAPSAPAGPVSVDIRGSCSNTVKVFYGDKPGYGSGTLSSVESNSISSHSFRPGEMMWVVDEHENGVASVTVTPSTHEIEVNCTAISAH